MRIRDLVAREPFGTIVEQTLTAWLSERFGHGHTVEWGGSPRLVLARVLHRETLWYVNDFLNAVFRPDCERRVLGVARREYGRSVRLHLRLPQAVYVQLATRPPFSRLLARPCLRIAPAPPGSEAWLLRGGNYRLRILDFAAQQVYVLPKLGFDLRFHRQDLHARRQWRAPMSAQVLLSSSPESWYAEELIDGQPLNRVARPDLGEASLGAVAKQLAAWSLGLATLVDGQEYVASCCENVRGDLQVLTTKENSSALVSALEPALDRLARRIRVALGRPGADQRILVGPTHGDFQPGNILVGRDATWLSDWERSDRRSYFYDPLTFYADARLSPDSSQRLAKWVADRDRSSGRSQVLHHWEQQVKLDQPNRLVAALVFLLEELAFHVEEAVCGPVVPGPGLRAVPDRIAALLELVYR